MSVVAVPQMRVLPPRTYASDTPMRKRLFTRDSVAHPAKMSLFLALDLFRRYTLPGQTVVDPFGGIGGSFIGALLPEPRHVLIVELEAKFCAWARANAEHLRHHTLPGVPLGETRVFRGDSRRLPFRTAADCVLGSPPFADSIANVHEGVILDSMREGTLRRSGKSMLAQDYGDTPGQIGALRHEPAAVITSTDGGMVQLTHVKEEATGHRGTDSALSRGSLDASDCRQVRGAEGCRCASVEAGGRAVADEQRTDGALTRDGQVGKSALLGGQEAAGGSSSEGCGEEQRTKPLPLEGRDRKPAVPQGGAEGTLCRMRGEAEPLHPPHRPGSAEPCTGQSDGALRELSPVVPQVAVLAGQERGPGDAQEHWPLPLGGLEEVSAVIGSPPYADVADRCRSQEPYSLAMDPVLKRRYGTGDTNRHIDGYGETPGQIGGLPAGDVSAVLASPPYAQAITQGGETGAWRDKYGYQGSNAGYSLDKANLGNLPAGEIAAALGSPPYGNTFSDWDATSRATREGQTVLYGDERWQGARRNIGNIPYYDDTLDTKRSPKAPEGAETYSSAVLQVYRECLRVVRPGGVLVLVTGDYVRGGKVVDLAADTIRLAVAAGWTPVERWRHEKAQVSFWRRLHHQQGRPTVTWEDVLVFAKGEPAWAFAELPPTTVPPAVIATKRPEANGAHQPALLPLGLEGEGDGDG